MISLEKIKAAEDEATQAIHEAETTAKKLIAAAGKNAKKLKEMNILNPDEKDVLSKIFEIKRKENKFWGM